ncbi:hypothetical protein IH575_04915 [Candidatus Dojkabacteria bacterium]|nr:hypothetical protein [Candidatus Dojkabacteria bacterium]
MAAMAEPLILTLIGPKWTQSIIYLQLLCFVGMLNPIHSLNLNILLVFGRSDLGLKLELIKVIIGIPVIFLGIYFGITTMIIGMIMLSMITFYINSYWSERFIEYSINEQIFDMVPYILYAFIIGGIMFFIANFLNAEPFIILATQIILGTFIIIFTSEIIRLEAYIEIKEIVLKKFLRR